LSESITKSHDEQEYFFRNSFEGKIEEQKVQYEKDVLVLEKDRNKLATQNRKLQEDKENLEMKLNKKFETLMSELSELKQKNKELFKIIRKAGIEYDKVKYLNNSNSDDDDEDAEDWTEPQEVVADTAVPNADSEVEVPLLPNADTEVIYLNLEELNMDDYVQHQNELDEERPNEPGEETLVDESYDENPIELEKEGKTTLEDDLSISDDSDDEYENYAETKKYRIEDLDSDCPEKDPAKIPAHLDKTEKDVHAFELLQNGLFAAYDAEEVPLEASCLDNESPVLEAFLPRPLLSDSPPPAAAPFFSMPGTTKQSSSSYEKSSIKEKLKRNMNNIVAVNASGNMCEKKRLEMQCLKKQSPTNLETSPKKVPQKEEANKRSVTMGKTAFSMGVKVADSATSNTKTKQLIPDIDAGRYQPTLKTRVSHVAPGSKQFPVINLSGSGSSGNENDNSLVPTFPKGAHNTSKAASKFAIKSIKKSFRKPSVSLARLQKTKSPKSEAKATKQTSTMKQNVPAAAGANDRQHQQAFAPPAIDSNLLQSLMQTFQMMTQQMQQITQGSAGIQFNPMPLPILCSPAGFQGMAPMPNNNPPAVGSAVNSIIPGAGRKQEIKRKVLPPPSNVSLESHETLSDSESEDIEEYESPLSPTPPEEEGEVKGTAENNAGEWKSSKKARNLINEAKTVIKDVLNSTEDDIQGIKSPDLQKNFKILALLPDRTLAM
jgi:hypothetical protein